MQIDLLPRDGRDEVSLARPHLDLLFSFSSSTFHSESYVVEGNKGYRVTFVSIGACVKLDSSGIVSQQSSGLGNNSCLAAAASLLKFSISLQDIMSR